MKGKLILFSSIVQGNGAKFVATNTAYFLNKMHETKTVVIDLDFENPSLAYEYTNHDSIHGIDNLLSLINSESLTDELFRDNIITTALGFDIIKGSELLERKSIFTKKIIDDILETALELYDFVFVVAGSKPNNAGTISSLLKANDVFLIARNNYSNKLAFPKVIEFFESYYPNQINIIHNIQNTFATSEFNEVLIEGKIVVTNSLSYDERAIDNIDLKNKKSIFSKGLNDVEFTKISKLLLKSQGIELSKKKKK